MLDIYHLQEVKTYLGKLADKDASRSLFINHQEHQYLLIDRLQQLQSRALATGIDLETDTTSHQRQQEISRIHAKLQRCRLQDTYAVVNWLITIAQWN